MTGEAGALHDPATVLEVLDGGLLTTIQDAGRPDWTHVGVPESGPMDPWSHAVANLLAGNEPDAAAVEMTLVGPMFRVAASATLTIALAGADLGARIRGGRPLATGRSHRLAGGDVVEIAGDPDAAPASSARGYLAVAGGVAVPVVLDSRSTCLAGGFGGFAGRPLQAGDRVPVGSPARPPEAELVWPDGAGPRQTGSDGTTLRVLATARPGLDELLARRWRVAAAADRVGVRLDLADGEPALPAGLGGEAISHGVPWGAIQLPPDGRPILLGADHQTTGGYVVVGVVISADRPVLGQLRPGAAVRLQACDPATAVEALREQRAALRAGAAALRDAAGWDALVDTAGG